MKKIVAFSFALLSAHASADMVITLTGKSIRTLPDGLPLVNSRNELVGLLVHKGNAIGFIPSSAIEEFVLRLNA